MPHKDPEARRQYAKTWYEANREAQIEGAKLRKRGQIDRNKKYVDDLRTDRPCAWPYADCGIFYPPYVMDVDHIADDKEHNIIQMVFAPTALEAIKAEIGSARSCVLTVTGSAQRFEGEPHSRQLC